MDSLKQYLIGILAAAIIGAIVMHVCDKHLFSANIIKLIVAIFISLNAIAPFLKFDIGSVPDHLQDFDIEANQIAEDAKSAVHKETVAVIIQRTEAYIEEKATLYGATVSADVSISSADSFVPDSVVITGNISPFGKISLKKIIEDDLAIPEDKQTWN